MKKILFAISIALMATTAKAQCLQIESILVDACVPGGGCINAGSPNCNCEGKNEMVIFKVGPAALNTANLTATWPSIGFLGWQTPNALTDSLCDTLNRTIIKCGYLKQPVGGVLPANSQVLIITSTDMCTGANSFANLTDTLYVIFQIAGHYQGHFVNQNNGATVSPTPSGVNVFRTLTLTSVAPSPACSEAVTYNANLLVNTFGTYGGTTAENDGATVEYDAAGNPTYVNNGCRVPYIPIQLTVNTPAAICSNGTVTVSGTVTGPATTYSWTTNGTGTLSILTGTLSASGTTTVNTVYTPGAGESGTITFTLTAHGKCSLAVVTNTVALTINPAPTPVISSSAGATICNGASTVLTATNTGATTYTWSPGGSTATTITVSPTNTVTPTVYTVSAHNTCGTTPATFTVTVNPTPAIVVNSPTICIGSTATLTASGASTYTWSTGTIAASTTVNPTVPTNYTVTGTNVTSCTATAMATVSVNALPTITIANDSVCKGTTGTLVANGTANTFTWNTGVTGSTFTVANVNSNATYTVTGTNTATTCTNTAVGNIIVRTQPTVNALPANICPGTTTTLTATGANTYTWNTGATTPSIVVTPTVNTTYTVAGTDINGCVSATATTSVTLSSSSNLTVTASVANACPNVSFTLTASGASPNTYTWTASDGTAIPSNSGQVVETQTASVTYTVSGSLGGGCTTSPATITVNMATPATLTVTANPANAQVCQGNSITLTASGASTYTWTPVITNGVGFVPASSQVYSVAATDGNGCPANATQSVTVNTPPVLSVSSQTICPTATAILSASPSTLTSYTWSTGAFTSTTTVSPVTSTPYTVSATDANGCVGTTITTVNVVNSLSITIQATHSLSCSGALDTLIAIGAQNYIWTPSVTSISATNNSVTVNPTTPTTYSVKGSSGTCLDSTTITIGIAAPIVISINASPSATLCAGSPLTLSGNPASTYTYTWSSGVVDGVSFTPPSSPLTQSYNVIGTDANGCTGKDSVTIMVNPTPTISINPSSPSVCLGEDSTTLIAFGSTILSYTWSTGATPTSTINVSPASTQTYAVIGTDGNGCITSGGASTTIIVNVPTPININSSMGNSVCSGATTTLTATSTQPSYTYTWNNGTVSNINTVSPVTPTSYSVNGIDVNGCKDSATISISISPAPGLPTVTGNTFVCWNVPTILTATDAVNGVNYVWVGPTPSTNTVSSSSTASITLPGTYVVIATNACGISTPASYSLIGDSVKAIITSPSVSPLTGFAPDTVVFSGQAISTNGTIISYHWSFGNGDSAFVQNTSEIYTAPSLSVNTYTATLIAFDNKGCWDTAHTVIIVNEIPTTIIIPNIFSPNGDGINDVFSIKATGISNFDCQVYDRWGILLHEWTGLDGGWDGKGKNGNSSPDGTYFYIINYKDIYSKTINKHGFFELIR